MRRRIEGAGRAVSALALLAIFYGCSMNEAGAPPDRSAAPEAMPRAISGGTLLITRDGTTAVASDPDRDRVWIVDLAARSVREVALEPGDEPGRAVEDADGRAHVVLRRGGAVVTLDVAEATVLDRRAVCAAPRGIAFDEAAGALHVACAGGELSTLPAAGGPPGRELRLDGDLRDVVVAADGLRVSRFRAAEVLALGPGGDSAGRSAPGVFQRSVTNGPVVDLVDFSANVAWRTAALPDGGLVMVHQRGQDAPVPLDTEGGYADIPSPDEDDGCGAGIVHSAVTFFDADGNAEPGARRLVPEATLPVDIAVSPGGDALAVVAAGSGTVTELWTDEYRHEVSASACTGAVRSRRRVAGTPVAAAYAKDGVLAVQMANPPALVLLSPDGGEETIALPGARLESTGASLFHAAAQGVRGIACASCHPEAGDDGRVWRFSTPGARRTQSLRGGVLATAPFHWSGDLADMQQLTDEVLVRRMGADPPAESDVTLLAAWLDAQPRLPASAPADPAAVERGRALFEGAATGCAGCHAGPQRTDDRSWDVGTGGTLQTPRLVDLAARGPWMHDGCARTLRERFDPACGGAEHGHTSQLSEGQIDDLVAYLEVL